MKTWLTKRWSRRVADFDNSTERSSRMRKNKSKTWREISAFDYRSVRFRATNSDWVASVRVICQDPNTMKTQNDNPFSLEWVIFSCCRLSDVSSSFKGKARSERWFEKPWQLNDRILKHCRNQGTRRKKTKIFHATVWSSKKFRVRIIVGQFAGKIYKKSAALYRTLSVLKHFSKKISRPKIAPKSFRVSAYSWELHC